MRDITARAHPSRRAQGNLPHSQTKIKQVGPKWWRITYRATSDRSLKLLLKGCLEGRGETEDPRRAPLLVDLRPGSVSFFPLLSFCFYL